MLEHDPELRRLVGHERSKRLAAAVDRVPSRKVRRTTPFRPRRQMLAQQLPRRRTASARPGG